MLPKEKQMEVLEAYDLTNSLSEPPAELTGVDHHTVAALVAARAAGHARRRPVATAEVADAFADKIAEWVERSSGKVRADVVHDTLGGHGLHRL